MGALGSAQQAAASCRGGSSSCILCVCEPPVGLPPAMHSHRCETVMPPAATSGVFYLACRHIRRGMLCSLHTAAGLLSMSAPTLAVHAFFYWATTLQPAPADTAGQSIGECTGGRAVLVCQLSSVVRGLSNSSSRCWRHRLYFA